MADESDDIRQEIKKGRQHIADTQSAIAEKLVILEHRLQEAVDGVKKTFDLRSHVKQRPWLVLGGAVLVGYALGRQGNVPGTTADLPGDPSMHALPQQNIGSTVKSEVENDIATIKGQPFFWAVSSRLWAMTKHLRLERKRQAEGTKDTKTIDRP